MKPNEIETFIRSLGGDTIITKVLIANNGIAAVKFQRSIQDWAYSVFGNEKAIQFVVMATPEDLKINAEYIRMADQYVEVCGGMNNNNYANVELIVDIAERTGSQAVWAGWGHASENPKLPQLLEKCNPKIAFLGPNQNSMQSLGDKISSTIVAQAANVPTLDWSGSGIIETYKDNNNCVYVSEETCNKACVKDSISGLKKAKIIGYPIMIKASEGGGGKGIRKANNDQEFITNFEQVKKEVPGSPIFLMKLAYNVRHLEVQLICDKYGNAISVFGRDCSVQRRHQKIIEEAPVVIASQERFEEMEKAAVRLAKLVGYESAGTVEYLYDPSLDKFYFLELNPRLQVEHPTTEMVSGINLPACQLQIAMNIPLNRISDIRRMYGLDPSTNTKINFDPENEMNKQNKDFSLQKKPKPVGHVIAVRITAENPEAGFKPSSGAMRELTFRSNTNVWGYFSVGTSGGLHEFADSQFGHIFAKGETREICRNNMVLALKNLSVRSDFRTTNEYIIRLLETQEFVENKIHTGWLDTLITTKIQAQKPDKLVAVISAALYKAYKEWNGLLEEFMQSLKKGQVLHNIIKTQFHCEFMYLKKRYKFVLILCAPNTFDVYLNGSHVKAVIQELRDEGYLILLNGKSHTVYAATDVGSIRLTIDSKTCVIHEENDPTKLRAPSPGKIVKINHSQNSLINKNDSYAEMEVMKMIMALNTTIPGNITYLKQEGSIVEAGEIIATITPLNNSNINTEITDFVEKLPELGTPYLSGKKPHQLVRELENVVLNCLRGYEHTHINSIIDKLFEIVTENNELPYYEINDLLSVYCTRVPNDLTSNIRNLTENHTEKFSSSKVIDYIESYKNKSNLDSNTLDFCNKIQKLCKSTSELIKYICEIFIEEYYSTEVLFDSNKCEQDVVLSLRQQHKEDLRKVTNIVISHLKVAYKNKVILYILDKLTHLKNKGFLGTGFSINGFRLLASLKSRKTFNVALMAREIVISYHYPSYNDRLQKMNDIIMKSINQSTENPEHTLPNSNILQELILSNNGINDTIMDFVYSKNEYIRLAALEVYTKRTYHNYMFTSTKYIVKKEIPTTYEWDFTVDNTNNSSSIQNENKFSSFTDLTNLSINNSINEIKGTMSVVEYLNDLEKDMIKILQLFNNQQTQKLNIIHIVLKQDIEQKDVITLNDILQSLKSQLNNKGIKRITLVVFRNDNKHPKILTFRHSLDYKEDVQIRNLEPTTAYKLELQRLQNFDISPLIVDNTQLHIYHAIAKQNKKDTRLFIRTYLRPNTLFTPLNVVEYLISEGDKLINGILDTLEILSATYKEIDCNHLFINFLPTFTITQDMIQSALNEFIYRHGQRLWKLRITEAEIKFNIKNSNDSNSNSVIPIRFFITNISGYVVKTEIYTETIDKNNKRILKSLHKSFASKHLLPVIHNYQPKEWLQPKRYIAQTLGTTYVYDFPELFKKAITLIWEEYIITNNIDIPKTVMKFKELVLDDNTNELKELSRPPGNNSCGMVAWIFEVYTPEYPNGRQLIVISNDITFNIGSFGPDEDTLFYKASKMARQRGLPRIYVAANSGARIGISEQIKNMYNIKWKDIQDKSKGFDFLYLTKENYLKVKDKNIVDVTELTFENKKIYKINYIIGENDGIGVECLKGSGLIAGETSRAYNDIFTITLVSCRTVGIGAYLARLGQRVIQSEGHPIILTGAPALNKVLGKKVYTSNLQLGGPQIMAKNGISHLSVKDDLEGVIKIMQWLSYVPKTSTRTHLHGITNIYNDSPNRQIDIIPTKNPVDPRTWLFGSYSKKEYQSESNLKEEWYSGFFDKGSEFETLNQWAKTVVIGRARLGGIPAGFIAVETRTTEHVDPADPADALSEEHTVVEAPQVWYPNSAHKTAQAIKDFNNGEQLPLFIFANWRGFSGGQRDMYNEILKFGSHIVDNLKDYKQPVFVYVIPNGELRGGAWVVLDSSINPEFMEMYADESSRGGVLEPEGIVEIKYRKPQIIQTIKRLDEKFNMLNIQLTEQKDNLTSKEIQNIESMLKKRESDLLPIYSQIALHFADLHDRPGRMKHKKVIRKILDFENSRQFFYWRLKRKIQEEYIFNKIDVIDNTVSRNEKIELLNTWFLSQSKPAEKDNDNQQDKLISNWLESIIINSKNNIDELIKLKLIDFRLVKYGFNQPNNTTTNINENTAVRLCQSIFNSLSKDEKNSLLARVNSNNDLI